MDIVFVAVAAFAIGAAVSALGSHWLRKNKAAEYDLLAAKFKELEARIGVKLK